MLQAVAGKKMAQPNVAREPSMEEILASIRRIIESNEPQPASAVGTGLPPVYADDELDEGDLDIVTELAANDPGQPLRLQAQQTTAADRESERSMSLADVAARVRAASARQENGSIGIVPAGSLPPVAASVPDKERSMESAPVLDGGREMGAEAPRSVVEASLPEPLSVAVSTRSVDVAPRPEPAGLPARVEALLSDEAGEQVARSFGELAAVFDGIEKRSVEDMAQEMLRPMLQAWLDDNLPTLVERLVREEIERVARGPRR
nr:hypothetical protein REQ54_01577 [Rhizobium sp. Q54]